MRACTNAERIEDSMISYIANLWSTVKSDLPSQRLITRNCSTTLQIDMNSRISPAQRINNSKITGTSHLHAPAMVVAVTMLSMIIILVAVGVVFVSAIVAYSLGIDVETL